jgi:hypothetical protein
LGFLYAWDNWISKSVGCSNLLALLFGPAFSDQAVVKFCQVLPIKLLPSFVNWQQCFSFNQLAAIVHQLKKSSAATLADAEVAIISVADAIILVSEYPMLSFLVFSNCRAPDTKLGPIDYLVWMDQINGLFLFMVIVMKLVGINSPVAMTKVTHDSNSEIRPRKTPFKTLLKLRGNLFFF